jgi:cob(I)alamin adenosyltransferase
MVHLTKIYTKTGDEGLTSIGNNERVAKISPLIEAIGSVDEANSAIGLARPFVNPYISALLGQVQNDLFDLGADLSVPLPAEGLRIIESQITFLEDVIDKYNSQLEPLHSFILPAGPQGAVLLHNARAIVRRAERDVWMAFVVHMSNDGAEVNTLVPKYLNRLSDLLFVFARYAANGDETLWVPRETPNQ